MDRYSFQKLRLRDFHAYVFIVCVRYHVTEKEIEESLGYREGFIKNIKVLTNTVIDEFLGKYPLSIHPMELIRFGKKNTFNY